MKFTTSWDDGHPLDFRVRDLLRAHGAKGTFYVAKSHEYVPEPLTDGQLRDLGSDMEIGAHTLTHPELTAVTHTQAKEEIAGSKRWLEEVLGRECAMFCYPRGKWSPKVKDLVAEAGFRGARSCENFRFHCEDPFLLPSTLHVYPFPLRPVLSRRALDPARRWWKELDALSIPLTARRGWLPMATAVFDRAMEAGAQFVHVRGHSWELEKYGMWDAFEAFLRHVRGRNVEHVVNSALLP